MKEKSREMGSSRRAEEIFRDCSGRRTDTVHALTNEREREVEQGFVDFSQLGLPPTSGELRMLCEKAKEILMGESNVQSFFETGGKVSDLKFQIRRRIGPCHYLETTPLIKSS